MASKLSDILLISMLAVLVTVYAIIFIKNNNENVDNYRYMPLSSTPECFIKRFNKMMEGCYKSRLSIYWEVKWLKENETFEIARMQGYPLGGRPIIMLRGELGRDCNVVRYKFCRKFPLGYNKRAEVAKMEAQLAELCRA